MEQKMNKTLVGVVAVLAVALVAITGMRYFASGKSSGGRPATPSSESQTKHKTQGGDSKVSAEATPSTDVPTVPAGAVLIDGKVVKVEEPTAKLPDTRSVVRRPLEPEATRRLHDGPVLVTALFEASGKGEHANYGKAIRGSYLYTTTVMAQSEILEKSDDKDTGKVFVKERRSFLQARDNLSLSDLDVAIALDTLPVEKVKDWAKGGCRLVAGVCTLIAHVAPPAAPYLLPVAGGAATANLSVDGAFAALSKIDGMSARGLLGYFGVNIPTNLEKFANDQVAKFVKKQAANVHVAIQSIEGKSFIVTYEQAKNGAPLNVDYKSEDGRPITETEWEMLRSANAFLDANVVPDARCRVGDTWTVWADEMQELFGASGNGRAEGKIRVERVEDQKDGAWTLSVEPSTIEFRSDDGTVAGKMDVKEGNGLVDAENASVKSLHATARGNLRSLDKKRHFMFFDFVKRIDGNSNMRFTLTVEPAKAETAK